MFLLHGSRMSFEGLLRQQVSQFSRLGKSQSKLYSQITRSTEFGSFLCYQVSFEGQLERDRLYITCTHLFGV